MTNIQGALPRKFLIPGLVVFAFVGLLLFGSTLAKADQMVATWYGPGFEGATTASGEPFDPNDYTAAHRTMAFGTKLIVTYNGASVVVRVNDRGPYVSGRDLDLSQAAAEYIGLTAVGSAVVDVAIADPSTPTGPYSGGAPATQEPAPAPSQDAQTFDSIGEEQGTDQYTDQYSAPQVAAAEAGPLESPPPELATPGSTVERRVQLAVAAEPAPAPAESPQVEETPAVLPDTGGAPLGALLAGVSLLGLGGLMVRRIRS